MITLLASIAGFISSIIPEILKFMKDKNDKSHELNILQLKIKQANSTQIEELNAINNQMEVVEQVSRYNTYFTGISWIDGLNGLVRPILAYSFFVMYSIVKYMQYKIIDNTVPHVIATEIIWSNEDHAIFAGIISFYFGQRSFRSLWKNKPL